MRTFKAASTWQIHKSSFSAFAWQRNYYEHVIRNEMDFDRIRQYIRDNPAAYELKGTEPAGQLLTSARPPDP